jgi:hypothetical protein
MLHTEVRVAGAIGLFFFWCAPGCVLKLDERGIVALSADRPANADRVVAMLSAGEGRLELELGDRTELTVPVGTVTISGEAFSGMEVVGSDQQTVEVGGGETVEVVLQLRAAGDAGFEDAGNVADSGVPEFRSQPIEATVRVREDGIGGGFLEGEPGMSDEAEFLAFRSDAQSELGAIGSITVASVSIQILSGAMDVGGFDDLWSDQIIASIIREDETAFVEIARGTSAATTQMQLEAIEAADLSPVSTSLASGRFKIGLRGETVRTGGEDFEAMVRAAVVYVAR